MKLVLKKENLLKYLLIAVFISTTLCFAIKFLGYNNLLPWNIAYNDVLPWSRKAFEPGMPYIDKAVEYPVIIGMTMYLATQSDFNFYMLFHYAIFLASAIISTIYLYKLSNKLQTKKKYLFLFWAIAPTLIWFVYFNWDIITVMFTVLALYYYSDKRDTLATIFVSLGFATKMYPLLLIFPVLMHRKFASWIKMGITFVLTFLAVNIFFMINNFQRWYFIYGFHGGRPPNIDSIWALLMNLMPGLSITAVNMITLILFASIYIYMNIKFKNKGFIYMSYLSILVFLLINKVFSPQFLLWLLPFFALYGLKLIPFYTLELSNIFVLIATTTHIFSKQDYTTALLLSGVFVVIRHLMLLHIFMKEYAEIKKPL